MTNSPDILTPRPAPFGAWGNAMAIWLLGCLLLGIGCFVLVGNQLRGMQDRYWAAVWWQLSFAGALTAILGVIVVMNRLGRGSLIELGLGKPASKVSIAAGLLLGLLYVTGVYAGILNDPSMSSVKPFTLHWIRIALVPVGVFMAAAEEIMMRGFFMNQLAQARVPIWAQIVLSGACSAVYHSLHDLTWMGFIPSFVLFSLHASLYVAAGRSLTPSILAHSMYHVLCAPYLLMFAMSQSAA